MELDKKTSSSRNTCFVIVYFPHPMRTTATFSAGNEHRLGNGRREKLWFLADGRKMGHGRRTEEKPSDANGPEPPGAQIMRENAPTPKQGHTSMSLDGPRKHDLVDPSSLREHVADGGTLILSISDTAPIKRNTRR